MAHSLFSPPDGFSAVPLLSLLPSVGQVARLDALTSSLYARYEKVVSTLKDPELDGDGDERRRWVVEELMLRQVLDWLAVKPDAS